MIDNNLKFIREDMEMTQKELGYVFGVHESTVCGWETGKDVIPLPKLIKFSNLSNCSIDYILKITRYNTEYSKMEKANKKLVGANLKKIRKELKLILLMIVKLFVMLQILLVFGQQHLTIFQKRKNIFL